MSIFFSSPHKESSSFERRHSEEQQTGKTIEQQGYSIHISPEEWKKLKEENPSYQDYVAWIKESKVDMEKSQPILEKHFPTISTGTEVKAMYNMPLSSLLIFRRNRL